MRFLGLLLLENLFRSSKRARAAALTTLAEVVDCVVAPQAVSAAVGRPEPTPWAERLRARGLE